MQAIGVRSKCVTLLIDGPEDADPWGREVLYLADASGDPLLDTKVGRLTSGGYSVAFEKSIGLGYVSLEHAQVGTQLKVKMLGELWDATIVEDSPYDPSNVTIRIDS